MYRKNVRMIRRRPPAAMLGSARQISWAREIYRCLIENHVRVRETCDVLALLTPDLDGAQLAEWYLKHLSRHQRRAEWWIVHRNELCAAWFMAEYIRVHLHAGEEMSNEQELEDAVYQEALLLPQTPQYPGAVTLSIEPYNDAPCLGTCALRYEQCPDFTALAHDVGMSWNASSCSYQRVIDETSSPLTDRAAEIGSRLLLNGFSVLVLDESVRDKICSGLFGWEYGRWIDCGSESAYLRLAFPKDRELFALARSMGAFWNGKQIEIGVWHADALKEFARLYDFRFTAAALARVEEWQHLYLRGKVVIPAKPPREPALKDPLQHILDSDNPIPEDLIDDN